jgi:hypothetical protein
MANALVELKMKLLLLCDFKDDTIVCVSSHKDSAIRRKIALGAVKLSLKVGDWMLGTGY